MKAKRSTITALVVIITTLALLGGANWWLHHERSTNAPNPSQPTSADDASADEPKVAKRPLDLYFIGLGDKGVSGRMVGCDDSLVEVKTAAIVTRDVLRATMNRLLEQHDQTLPGSGLYNALASSRLVYQSGEIHDGTVTVKLVGTLSQGGECDAPRIKAQLEQAVLTAADVKHAEIYINGAPIDTALSLK